MTSPSTTTTCPRCSAAATGNFCASCGSPLAGATCVNCDAALTPGANFCHRCGTPAPSARHTAEAVPVASGEVRSFSPGLPWGIAIVAFVALVALVVGQRFGARSQLPAGANAGAVAVPSMPLGARAPDISTMSAEEQATRLHDRVMGLAERGRTDSVQ